MLRSGRPAASEPLLGTRGKIIRSRGRDKLVAACGGLGIEPFTWHGVRRRVVRRLRRAGVSVKAAATFLGHSPTVMLRIYDEISDDDLEEELSRLWTNRGG